VTRLRTFVIAAALAAFAAGAAADTAVDPAVGAADGKFLQAATHGDGAALASQLDADLQWTDPAGRTMNRQAVTTKVPTVGVTTNDRVWYGYGPIAVAEANDGKLHALRIWVKRPAGWKLLVYQEVRSLDAPATATPGTGTTCENPCGAVPYTPKNATERAVMQAYSELEAAATGHKEDAWKMRAADEIALVSSNSDRTFDKPTRAAAIGKATLGGVAPTKLLTAKLFDFNDVVVMTSQHETDKGQRLHITRVWVNRDPSTGSLGAGGRWQETLSYQTAVR